MFDIFANTFMTATRTDDPNRKLTRVRDVQNWDAPSWWRNTKTRRATRYIDLDKL